MKILYSSDYHGDELKYNRTLELAKENGIEAVINGGDLLGSFYKHGKFMHKQQKEFIESFLFFHFKQYEDAGIHWLGTLGNDDLIAIDKQFSALCNQFTYVHNLTERLVELNGFGFIGFSYVVDYPFSPKERCRRDDDNYALENQPKEAFISTSNHWETIPDWTKKAFTLPTLYEMLNQLPSHPDNKKTIYVIHHPLSQLGLCTLKMQKSIGSNAVRKFLEEKQPLLSLHGHVHEGPGMTGKWQGEIGQTKCLQAGQIDNGLVYCIIVLETMSLNRFVERF